MDYLIQIGFRGLTQVTLSVYPLDFSTSSWVCALWYNALCFRKSHRVSVFMWWLGTHSVPRRISLYNNIENSILFTKRMRYILWDIILKFKLLINTILYILCIQMILYKREECPKRFLLVGWYNILNIKRPYILNIYFWHVSRRFNMFHYVCMLE